MQSEDLNMPTISSQKYIETRISHSNIRTKNTKRNYKTLNLLIKDIPNTIKSDGTIKEIYFNRKFSIILFYGRVTSHQAHFDVKTKAKKGIYQIDDGTGKAILVHYDHNKHKKTTRNISYLEQKIHYHKTEGICVLNEILPPKSEKCVEMIDAMDTILNIVDKNMSNQCKYFQNGDKLFIFGVPFLYNQEIRFNAFNIEKNTSEDNEISWYEFLINEYKNYFESVTKTP